MIAFIDDLPLVEFENGEVCAFRREWLHLHLVHAAEQAGYRNWWLAGHVAQSVTNYLTTQYQANTLSASELRLSVAEVLATIGYAEVALHFVPTRPSRDISLLELTKLSSTHELTFFSLLRDAITVELEDGMIHLSITNIGPAVKKLLGVKILTEECSELRMEIVAFIRCIVAPQPTIHIIIH
jgi:hypothetical protein